MSNGKMAESELNVDSLIQRLLEGKECKVFLFLCCHYKLQLCLNFNRKIVRHAVNIKRQTITF